MIRKKLRNLSNQKHRDPENLSLRLHNGELLKQYRNTLQKKKEQQFRNHLNLIEESIESNHFWETWKTLNKQQVTARLQVQTPELTRYKSVGSAPEQAINSLFLGRH